MEKFNPSDYEKISDMPKEMQGRFREVPEGGFVRASVEDGPTRAIESGDKFVDRFTSYFKERREKLADRAVEDQMALIHEEAMLMDSETSRRVNEILARGDSGMMELATEYQNMELKLDGVIKSLNDYESELSARRESKIDQIKQESQDKIRQMGHTGELNRNYCVQDACEGKVTGVIDGKSIDLSWDTRGVGGSIDGQSVSTEVAQALLGKFLDASADTVIMDGIRKGNYRDPDVVNDLLRKFGGVSLDMIIDRIRQRKSQDKYEYGEDWDKRGNLEKEVREIKSKLWDINRSMEEFSDREASNLKSVEKGEKGDKIASSLLK